MDKNVGSKEDVVRLWWAKAERSLGAAKREHEAGAEEFAINRIYYAAFFAISCWLLEQGKSFSKHTAVRAAFNRDLIKRGLLEEKWADFYNDLFEDRNEGDYSVSRVFEPSYVERRLMECADFIQALRPHVASVSR